MFFELFQPNFVHRRHCRPTPYFLCFATFSKFNTSVSVIFTA